jgi:hypothetical protein
MKPARDYAGHTRLLPINTNQAGADMDGMFAGMRAARKSPAPVMCRASAGGWCTFFRMRRNPGPVRCMMG